LQKENSLKRSTSLKSRVEIGSLFDTGERIRTELFNVFWKKADQFKFGVFIKGSKVNAVYRNKIKRIYREAIRLNKKLLTDNYLIAINPKTYNSSPSFNQVNDEIIRTFEKINSIG
jgi:ribonuclease P protein component